MSMLSQEVVYDDDVMCFLRMPGEMCSASELANPGVDGKNLKDRGAGVCPVTVDGTYLPSLGMKYVSGKLSSRGNRDMLHIRRFVSRKIRFHEYIQRTLHVRDSLLENGQCSDKAAV